MKRPEELSHMLTEITMIRRMEKFTGTSVCRQRKIMKYLRNRSKWRTVYPGRSMNVMFLITVNIRDRIF